MRSIADGLRTLGDVDVEDQRVLVRADLDVPLTRTCNAAPATVADDTRIRTALVTIDELRRRGARVVLVSHLGRPSGHDPAWSMQPVAERLTTLTGTPVRLAPAVVGQEVCRATRQLSPGDVLLLENAWFEPGEARNDPRLASALAELADLYVDDAFAVAHRACASTEGVAHLLPCAAGRQLERDLYALTAVMEQPARPLVAVFGGVKFHDKFGVIRRFLELADAVCIGGALCYPFLAALGHEVGHSLCPQDDVELAREALAAVAGTERLELPEDLALARWGAEDSRASSRLDGVDVPAKWMGLDIGTKTATRYARVVAAAATVFWNGPMGRFTLTGFACGTRVIADAVASTSAMTVVAGADTEKALRTYGLQERVSYLSSGERSTFEFLEGRQLPGIQALLRAPAAASGQRCDSAAVDRRAP